MQCDGITISNDKELVSAAHEFLDGVLSYFAFSVPSGESGERLYSACMRGEAAKAYLDFQLLKRSVISNRLMKSEELLDKGYRVLDSIDGRMLKTVDSKRAAGEDFYEDA